MVHTVDHLVQELEKLNCTLPESYKINFLMLRIREVAPEIYIAVATKIQLTYDQCITELKSISAHDTAIDIAKVDSIGRCSTLISRKTDKREQMWRPGKDQCYWCLKRGHTVQQCRRRLDRESSTRRPDGSYYKGKLMKRTAKKNQDMPKSFMATSFEVEANIEGTSVSNSVNNITD